MKDEAVKSLMFGGCLMTRRWDAVLNPSWSQRAAVWTNEAMDRRLEGWTGEGERKDSYLHPRQLLYKSSPEGRKRGNKKQNNSHS